ncbi:MAG: HlyD family type I secretion periplasmic adaptor subunit [Burkholderiales bacterium]|nr:HlyD family type I secretion periplasmic adaptor subunit [Burkholderiales bacterium]
MTSGTIDLFQRYARVLRFAWKERRHLESPKRQTLERQFLPAALEITETPAPVLAHALLWFIIGVFLFFLGWSILGKVDVVAVAQGQVIASGKAKVIQPAETAVVKRIHITDGQQVEAGDVLIELEAAGTASEAESQRIREALIAAKLESLRYGALASAARNPARATTLPVSAAAKTDLPADRVAGEAQALRVDLADYRAKLASIDADIAHRTAERDSAKELVGKLARTAPIAQRRAGDYKALVDQKFVSEHGYLERQQAMFEQEGDLAFQSARVRELEAGIQEGHQRRSSLIAEVERTAIGQKLEADKRMAQLEQELLKAQSRQRQQRLVAPVDGTVQQLAVHTEGGVVTEAQPLMVIAPSDYQAEVEATLENKDVGFVKVGQRAEVKVETFPFTRYGTIPGVVSFVSNDAVQNEKRGPTFQVRVRLDRGSLVVDQREVNLSPGMAVSAEVMADKRTVIAYLIDPIRRRAAESFRER